MDIIANADTMTVRFETSLIMSISAGATDLVNTLRLGPLLSVEAVNLPTPHMTLLFVGFLDRTLMEDLRSALVLESDPRIEVELEGYGLFRRDDGTCNIHLRVTPQAGLLALHQWALNICNHFYWTPPVETSGSSYRPHITIADGALEPDFILAGLPKLDLSQTIHLNQLHFRSHPLKA